MTIANDDYYLKNLIKTSDHHKILATKDIYNSHGVKLVSSGTEINQKLYQRLVNNKLLKPIDSSLKIEHGVDHQFLEDELKRLSDSDFTISIFSRSFHREQFPYQIIRQIPINRAITVKLTVTRDQAPQKFRHLIAVAIASLYIGECLGLTVKQLIQITCAGLLHDLGEMHIDPSLSDSSTNLTAKLRRQIYSHPLIIHLILNQFPEYNPEISQAVLDHHERLDGSGYPRCVSEIGLFARIIAAAELGVILLDKTNGEPDWNHLATSLKVNSGKYDSDLLNLLITLFKQQPETEQKNQPGNKKQTIQMWQSINHSISELNKAQGKTLAKSLQASKFALKHISALDYHFSQAGINLDLIAQEIELLDESSHEFSELHSMAKETLYRIREIKHEILRRWPEVGEPGLPNNFLKHWLESIN